jgi:hypothetical protein
VQIMVQLEAPLARALREGTPASHAIRDAAARAGVTLRPAHPAVSDPPLSTWFTADLRDGDVPRALAALQSFPGVTAAYAKPQDALP